MFVLGIPRCNEPPQVLAETVSAALASSAKAHLSLIVDNGDAPLEDVPGFTVLRPGRNTGCAGAWNIILRRAFDELEAPSAVVLNGDCAVSPDTFARMLDSPRRFVCAHGFSCFRIDRDVWQVVGEFDEEFYPVYWEDTDYRRRLELAGEPFDSWEVAEVSRPSHGRALHVSGITHGKTDIGGYQGWSGDKLTWFQSRLEANRQRYISKWGGLPGEERFLTPFGE